MCLYNIFSKSMHPSLPVLPLPTVLGKLFIISKHLSPAYKYTFQWIVYVFVNIPRLIPAHSKLPGCSLDLVQH